MSEKLNPNWAARGLGQYAKHLDWMRQQAADKEGRSIDEIGFYGAEFLVAEGVIYTNEEFEIRLRDGTIPKGGMADVDITKSKMEFQVVSGPEAQARFAEAVEKARRTGRLGTTTHRHKS